MKTFNSDISKACMLADKLLWDAYARRGCSEPDIHEEGHLVFPPYRKNGTRVSEQEARFAFAEALCRGPFRYSVEAPTSKRYSFRGRGSRSAATDLQIHGADNTAICNVEFKAKGVSPEAKDISTICKDIEKLLREPVWGLWFHILEGVNNSTIQDLIRVISTCICQAQDEFKNDVDTPGLTLHICVLRQGFSLQKNILLPINKAELDNWLDIDLQVSTNDLEKEKRLNGWKLERARRQ